MASPLLRLIKSKFIPRGVALQLVSDSCRIRDWKLTSWQWWKLLCVWRAEVKWLACINFSYFTFAAVLKTDKNVNSLPAFMNSGCPSLCGCMCMCVCTVTLGEWKEELYLEKNIVYFGAVTGLEGHWQRLVNATSKNVAHRSEKKRTVMHLE